ncbi:ferredoxin [Faecalibacterium sp. 7]|uniref:ferredoxin n=1 Tax=Faecalibacterium sp. 7 TaxID=3402017 RepID=UPI003C2F14ED
MNAYVDPDLCIGCTQCAGLCPAVFHMEGVLAVAEPGPIRRRRCRRLWMPPMPAR